MCQVRQVPNVCPLLPVAVALVELPVVVELGRRLYIQAKADRQTSQLIGLVRRLKFSSTNQTNRVVAG